MIKTQAANYEVYTHYNIVELVVVVVVLGPDREGYNSQNLCNKSCFHSWPEFNEQTT